MKSLIRGFAISLFGALPLGVINVTAVQIFLLSGWEQVLLFSLGVMIVEVTYVRVLLLFIGRVKINKGLFKYFSYVVIVIMLLMAYQTFFGGDVNTSSRFVWVEYAFWAGLLISLLNPLQIPYWLGWSAYLFSKNILRKSGKVYTFYLSGIALGTFSGLLAYILAGHLILNASEAQANTLLNKIIGLIYLGIALFLILKTHLPAKVKK